MGRGGSRLRVAAVNDYELIVAGLSAMLSTHSERIEVADSIVLGSPIDGDGYWSANHPPAIAVANALAIREARLGIGLFCGSDDDLSRDGTRFLHHALDQLGIDHRFRMVAGGRHDQPFFAHSFAEGLSFIAGSVAEKCGKA